MPLRRPYAFADSPPSLSNLTHPFLTAPDASGAEAREALEREEMFCAGRVGKDQPCHSMKMLLELTTADLDADAIWRYDGEDDVRASVEPDTAFRVDGSGGAWIAKTRFTLADGTELPGYCSPMDDGIDYVQPVMLVGGVHHVPLFLEAAPDGMDTVRVCERIGKAHKEIFPITFLCLVPLPDGTQLSGVIRAASDPDAMAPQADGN